MKPELSEEQQEVLLSRHAGQTRFAPLKAHEGDGTKGGRRALRETVAGLFMGIPLGVVLYYITLAIYCPIMYFLLFAGSGIGTAFHIPSASRQGYVQSLNFGPVTVGILASLATAFCLYFIRASLRQGYGIFAWVLMPLTLPVSLALFYLTFLYHKPLLPFYGQ